MKPALLIIDMQRFFFRTEERSFKLKALLRAINQLALKNGFEIEPVSNDEILSKLTLPRIEGC